MPEEKTLVKVIVSLSIIGGFLSALAWFPGFSGLILFISLTPMFLLALITKPHDAVFGNRLLFIRVLPGLLIFNCFALAWIRIAGIPLLFTAIAGNTFLMAFTFWLGWLIRQKAGAVTGNAAYIFVWLAMEYATNRIPFLSPWLNLGNGLATDLWLIQWYEFTGVSGGTLWILLINMYIARTIYYLFIVRNRVIAVKNALILPLIIAIPIVVSLLIKTDNLSGKESTGVVLIQPCSDPYSEKFVIPFSQQLENMLEMAQSSATEKTNWFITPETSIDDPIDLSATDTNRYVSAIASFLYDFPDAVFILGSTTMTPEPEMALHNSAMLITNEGTSAVYHKSKLVPGIERTFGGASAFLQRIFPDLGGTTGGYKGQDGPSLLIHPVTRIAAGPVICFESVFGEHVAQFVRMGAELLIVITNDGWWKGTHGYHQHLTFSSLRAIETRRTVVRAANTGVSAIITPDGKITSSLPWWEPGVLFAEVEPVSTITFYVKYGDLISGSAMAITLLVIITHLLAIPIRRSVDHKKKYPLCNLTL